MAQVSPHSKLIIDGTLGHGGHSILFTQQFPQAKTIWLDIDQHIIQQAKERLTNVTNFEAKLCSYTEIDKITTTQKADFILLDLWVNIEHFKDWERGFSLQYDAPLDMRFDQNQKTSAQDVINTFPQDQLLHILQDYADFTPAKSLEITQTLIRNRNKQPITTTKQLKQILGRCWLGNKAITIIFQAIRIQVNQEINNIQLFFNKLPDILNPWGRCAIMSYHSIEDRLTKKTFKTLVSQGNRVLVHKKVIKPHYTEVQKNKAARSAKLRIIQFSHTL